MSVSHCQSVIQSACKFDRPVLPVVHPELANRSCWYDLSMMGSWDIFSCASSDMMAICEMLRLNGVGSSRAVSGRVGPVSQSVYVMSVGVPVSLSQVSHSLSVRKLCLSVSQFMSGSVRHSVYYSVSHCQSFGLPVIESATSRSVSHCQFVSQCKSFRVSQVLCQRHYVRRCES